MNFQDYNDPTYLLAVKKQAILKKTDDQQSTTLNNVTIVTFSALENISNFQEKYDINSFGNWNYYLANWLRSNRENRYYKIIESFALTGILAAPITDVSNNIYYFFIIPPYLAQYWDDYYKPNILGNDAISAISMTPARYNLHKWSKNADKFVESVVLGKKLVSPNSNIRNYIEDLSQSAKKVISGENLANSYVGVFAYALVKDQDEFLVPNIAFHVTKTVFESMRRQEVKAMPSRAPAKVTVKDIKKITADNIIKLQETEATFMDPLYCIYVESIPMGSTPFKFTSKYASVIQVPISNESVPKSLIDAQRCILGQCFLASDSPATGFIDLRTTPEKFSPQINVNCSAYDPMKTQVLAQEFGITKLPNESYNDLCERAKKAIQIRLQQTGRKSS